MGFQSQSGQVGIRTQATPAVYADPGAAPPNHGVFFPIRSGALGGNRELMIPDPEIGGNRDRQGAKLGPVSFSGEYDFYIRSEMTAMLLKGCLGTVVTTTSGAGPALVGTHTITPATTLPWVSLEEAIANGYETFRYTDAKVNSFHLEADADGYVMGTAALIAKTQTAGNTRTIPANTDWDTTPLLVGAKLTVLYNALTLPAKSISFDITNNIEDDDFRLGSLFLGDVTEKQREVNASITIRPADSALWRQAMYGSAVATSAAGQAAEQAVSIVVESYEVIGTSIVPHRIQIDAPKAVIAPFELGPSGDDVLEHEFDVQFLRPDPALEVVTVIVKNGLAALN